MIMNLKSPKRQLVYLGRCQVCGETWTMHDGKVVDHATAAPGINPNAPCPGAGEMPIERSLKVARTRIAELHALARDRKALAAAIEDGSKPTPYYRLVKGNKVDADEADIDPVTRERQRVVAVNDTRIAAVMAEREGQRIGHLVEDRFNGAFERGTVPGCGDMVKSCDIITGLSMVMPGTFGIVHRVEKRGDGFFAIGVYWSTTASSTVVYPTHRLEIVDPS